MHRNEILKISHVELVHSLLNLRGAARWSPDNHLGNYIVPSRGSVRARHLFSKSQKEAKDMAISKRLMTTVVLLCAAAMIMGCGSSSVSPEDLTEAPLLPPTNVTISRVNGDQILITWDMSTQANLAGYNVYRATGSSNAYSKLNSTLISQNQYLDMTAARRVHHKFRVCAVSDRGVEGTFASASIFNGSTGGVDKSKDPQL